MISNALAGFVGAFAALLVLAEISAANKIVRYFAALVVGVVVTFLLAWLVQWVGHIFARV
jgi:uncharacterized membrane protein YGL010W